MRKSSGVLSAPVCKNPNPTWTSKKKWPKLSWKQKRNFIICELKFKDMHSKRKQIERIKNFHPKPIKKKLEEGQDDSFEEEEMK